MSHNNLKDKISEINDLVEPVISELLTWDLETDNNEIALYQCSVGGKRIRPALVIISGQVFGGDVKDLVYPAAAIEILHNATLIVDDIINHSEIRRNQPTCWKKFGQSIAECSSMIHFASVFADLSYANNSSKLINFYSKILKIVVEGEIKDILFERSGRKDEDYVINKRYSVKGTTISK